MFLQFKELAESPLTFPVLECIHIAGLAMGIGTIAAVDFRILGFALPTQKASDLATDLAPWTMLGLGLVILSGCGLFISDPDLYYLNHSFQLKMTLLLTAIIFHYTIHQRRALSDTPDSQSVAIISLVLWSAIVFCGIFIAFTGALA